MLPLSHKLIIFYASMHNVIQYETVVEMDSVTVVTDRVTRNQIDQSLSTSR